MKKQTFLYSVYVLLFTLFFGNHIYAQENSVLSKKSRAVYTIRGSVLDMQSLKPVARVNVEVTGGDYTTTTQDGEFRIRARIGDELVIRSTDFQTVYYTIKDEQRIRIEVQPVSDNILDLDDDLEEEEITLGFEDYMQLAEEIYKTDASKGVDNVALALAIDGITNAQRADAFLLLGDIYTQWKQYDLAVANYVSSLKNQNRLSTEIILAKGYYNNKNYQESIDLYIEILNKKIAFDQNLIVLEGLGDTYLATGSYENAIQQYSAAEEIAKTSDIISIAARLNAKIADAYDRSGVDQQAITYYDQVLELSTQENSESASRSKVKVADYYNKTKSYDDEITLRKEALEGLRNVNTDSISNDDILTSQKQNYKIANAYAAQEKYDDAIPFFEKSIAEAIDKEDIIVEKDARRRLSELYRDQGNFEKAVESYERYKALVDEGYARKEQEIAQASRFSKDITEKQNRILSLEKDRELNEGRYKLAFQEQELANARDNKQKLIIGSLAVVTLLLLITAFAMFRSSKQQKYANNLLALKGLRSQMNPHFIFNALNSVNSFIATSDERTANKYLSDFSSLMRAVLENSEEDFIPLSSEIELIKKYTMLEHFRFKDKFDYTLTIDDNLNVDTFQIPPMLLQPYVENAVWHGMRYKEEKGLLHIYFGQQDENTAIISVTDDGIGRKRSKAMKTENQKKQKSKGMGNIKKRIAILNEMYGDRIDVAITDVFENGEGTKVTLIIKKD